MAALYKEALCHLCRHCLPHMSHAGAMCQLNPTDPIHALHCKSVPNTRVRKGTQAQDQAAAEKSGLEVTVAAWEEVVACEYPREEDRPDIIHRSAVSMAEDIRFQATCHIEVADEMRYDDTTRNPGGMTNVHEARHDIDAATAPTVAASREFTRRQTLLLLQPRFAYGWSDERLCLLI